MTYSTEQYADDLYAVDTPTSQTTPPKRLITPFGVVVMLAVIGLIGVVAYGIYRNEQDTLSEGQAPDFALTVYDDDDIEYSEADAEMLFSGQDIRLSDFEGVVVINLWQSNCPPCHEEAEMLVRVYEDYLDDGVIFIGVNAKDPDSVAHDYLAQYNITYPNGLDRGDRFQADYRTKGYPETFVIDANGEIVSHYAGLVTEADLRNDIEQAIQRSEDTSQISEGA